MERVMLGASVRWTGWSEPSPTAAGTTTLPMHRTVTVQCIQPFEPTGMRFCD